MDLSRGIGFMSDDDNTLQQGYERMKSVVLEKFKKTFRPEFLNRIDEVLVFQPLTRDEIAKIVQLFLNRVRESLKSQGLGLVVSDELIKKLAEEGFDPTLGARPLRRAIQRMIEDPLAEEFLQGKFRDGDTINADLQDGKVVFSKAVHLPDLSDTDAVSLVQN
jgi:ATP-dependent Clp protease ATP-binding subunit ClpC